MKYIHFLLGVLLPACAWASPNPCIYGGIGMDEHYRIGKAYAAAEKVVSGKVTGHAKGGDISFAVDHVYKGNVDAQITLRGQKPVNTEYNGFSLRDGQEVLLLLRSPDAEHVYDAVEDYNTACATYFRIQDNSAILLYTDQDQPSLRIPVDKLQPYLEHATDFTYKLQP